MNTLLDTQAIETQSYSNSDGSLSLKQGIGWDVDRVVHSGKSFLQTKLATLKLWKNRVEARRELAFQSDYILEDMGLTRSDVDQEATKWFWQN